MTQVCFYVIILIIIYCTVSIFIKVCSSLKLNLTNLRYTIQIVLLSKTSSDES